MSCWSSSLGRRRLFIQAQSVPFELLISSACCGGSPSNETQPCVPDNSILLMSLVLLLFNNLRLFGLNLVDRRSTNTLQGHSRLAPFTPWSASSTGFSHHCRFGLGFFILLGTSDLALASTLEYKESSSLRQSTDPSSEGDSGNFSSAHDTVFLIYARCPQLGNSRSEVLRCLCAVAT